MESMDEDTLAAWNALLRRWFAAARLLVEARTSRTGQQPKVCRQKDAGEGRHDAGHAREDPTGREGTRTL